MLPQKTWKKQKFGADALWWGTGEMKMWKRPIAMLPIINAATRIGHWVWALATFSHWQHFFVPAQAP
jgi:hypothetical protein